MWQSDSGSFNSQLVGVYVYVYILTRKNVFNMLAVFIQFICPKCQSTHVAHEHFNGIYSLFVVGTSRTLHTQHTKYNFWSSLEHVFYSFISKFLYFFRWDENEEGKRARQRDSLSMFTSILCWRWFLSFHSISFGFISFCWLQLCNFTYENIESDALWLPVATIKAIEFNVHNSFN